VCALCTNAHYATLMTVVTLIDNCIYIQCDFNFIVKHSKTIEIIDSI
jgi:hypothetical protein